MRLEKTKSKTSDAFSGTQCNFSGLHLKCFPQRVPALTTWSLHGGAILGGYVNIRRQGIPGGMRSLELVPGVASCLGPLCVPFSLLPTWWKQLSPAWYPVLTDWNKSFLLVSHLCQMFCYGGSESWHREKLAPVSRCSGGNTTWVVSHQREEIRKCHLRELPCSAYVIDCSFVHSSSRALCTAIHPEKSSPSPSSGETICLARHHNPLRHL